MPLAIVSSATRRQPTSARAASAMPLGDIPYRSSRNPAEPVGANSRTPRMVTPGRVVLHHAFSDWAPEGAGDGWTLRR